ncbi:hypothetical protein ACVIRO_003131 [Rhizobium ruizarguesonis]
MAHVDAADVAAPRNDGSVMLRPSNAVVPKAHSGSGQDDVRAHPNVRSLKIRSLKLPVR